jgi:ketosteroid isomerase-like protein
MSPQNTEVVRQIFEAFNRQDGDAGLALVDPDVEWDTTAIQLPGLQGVWHRHEGVRRFWRTWFAELSEFRFELHELIDAGDEVVAITSAAVKGRASGASVTRPFFPVYTVRGGLVVRFRLYDERARALEAAGLRE